ncbi:stage II sporulation protein D [Cohnella sp. AR92]|uniref:stage II sporulation protein D n=1 Tax=Cohnella sp. AR92 TaxID=648716 RepID=UPI000F8F8223|nr:stage II sporulation protein D [Cohnella sp. AR92]RUS49191.1 stage II sporulation protein D [Cohnella sp. AR92]
MSGKRRVDWMAFAVGICVGMIVWLFSHETSYRLGKDRGAELPEVRRAQSPSTLTGAAEAPPVVAASAAGVRESGRETGRSKAPATAAGGTAGSNNTESSKVSKDAMALLDRLKIKVYLADKREVETVTLEQYVRGVVAAELPLAFEPAAMEAQALAARTYIVRRLVLEDRTGIPETGTASEADVTDTVTHQVYKSLKEMAELKESDREGWSKVDRAVERTKGRIIVYEGEPIQALFFASSNGHTENSEEVFPMKLPYLRSVDSPWDRTEASNWEVKSTLGLTEFYKKMGVGSVEAAANPSGKSLVRILDWTTGGRVKDLLVGDERVSGEEAREKLGLRSAAFSLKQDKQGVHVTTYGSGHGVGMSQWGAEGMAKQGKGAEEIIKYYYKGVQLAGASEWLRKLPL